jgi:hypothetical protein
MSALSASIVPEPQDLQPFGHKRAVHAFERHHVAHGGERHEVEQAEQIRFSAGLIKAVAAERPRRGHQKEKHHAGSSKMSLAREIVLTVGVEHRKGRRQLLVGRVVVDDNDLGAASVGGLDGSAGSGAAINGDDESRPLVGKPGERGWRRAVAFAEAVGDVGCRTLPVGAQEALDERHGGCPIDVVIAENGDGLACADGTGETLRRLLHVLQACRIGQEMAEGWIEEVGNRRGIGAARGKQPPDQLRQAVGLGDGHRGCGSRGIEALDPTQAASRPLHPEEGRRGLMVQCLVAEGRGHAQKHLPNRSSA